MPAPLPVRIPLLNPNEVEAALAGLHVREGQSVRAGEVLATLETTKSTGELAAERDGFVIGLRRREGDSLRAGEVLCYLADAPGDPLPEAPSAPAEEALPTGLRISRPALALAQQHGLDLERLPRERFVTEGDVRALLGAVLPEIEVPPGKEGVIVYGGGGHGKSLVELVRLLPAYAVVGVVDDGLPPGAQVLGAPLLGGGSVLAELAGKGVRLAINAVGGIGDLAPRLKVFERLAEAGFTCPAVVHPTAFVEASAQLAQGVQVFPHAYVGSAAQVGFGAIVNTGAIVSHDCALGDFTNISPGAMLAGGVQTGERVLVGMGATVNLGVKIGSGARVGNGATVKADVPAGSVVRAGTIWPA